MARGAHRKVWIVEGEVQWEATWVDSIWTSKKAAVARADHLNEESARIRPQTHYGVMSAKLNTTDSYDRP